MKRSTTQSQNAGTTRCLGIRFGSTFWTLVAVILCTFGTVRASHYAGFEYEINKVAGVNENYSITFKIYRDCRGIALANPHPMQLVRLLTNTIQNFSVTRSSVTDITPLCPGQQSYCATPIPGLRGITENVYTQQVSNLLPLENYRVQSTNSARNGAITTGAANQLMYIYANFRTGLNNSSPRFLNKPIADFCVNQPAVFSPNGFDPDGDAIVYALQNCLENNISDPVTYNPGFSGTNPVTSSTGVTLNPSTGALSFTPSVSGQVAIICLRADEFRNGVLIGSVVRDMQINVLNCSNTPPVIAPLPNVVVNVGQTYCTPVSATDANNNQITLTAVSGIIPPATFTLGSSGAGFANATFCFTPTIAHIGNTYTVTINAQDNACPSPGTGVVSFNITVPLPCNMTATATGTDAACGVNNGTATVNVLNGTAPFQFSWTGPSGFSAFTQSISGLAPGTYDVLVVDGNSCVANASVTIGGGLSNITATATSTPANCNQNNGTITISASGGTAPYQYSLNGGAFQSSNTFTGLAQGSYTFQVMDVNGCTFDGTASVGEARDLTPPTITCPGNITASTDPGVCCATVNYPSATATDDCGSVTVAQTGGPASGTCMGLGTHTVTFTATDVAGNQATCSFTITVSDNEAPSITCPADVFVNCVADIPNAEVGQVTTSDNCSPVAVGFSETSTGSGCDGDPRIVTRTFTAEDQNHNSSSCTQTVTAEAAPVVATCSGNAYVIPAWLDSSCTTISVSGSGGCGPYRYMWCDGNQSASRTVCPTQSTTYCVTVTDAQGCSASCCVTVCAVDITCSGGTNNGQNGTGQSGNGVNQSMNAMQHIAICHVPPGNSGNTMTKCLPIPAAVQHFTIGHGGDYLGACGSLPSRNCTTSRNCGTNKTDGSDMIQAGGTSISMNVFPNPSNGMVNVELACMGCNEGSYTLKVTDIYGKQFMTADVAMDLGAGKTKIDLSKYAAGVYMVILQNGDQRIVERVVKQ